jgi:hypothetical protein
MLPAVTESQNTAPYPRSPIVRFYGLHGVCDVALGFFLAAGEGGAYKAADKRGGDA